MAQYVTSVLSKYVPQLKKDSGNVVLDRVFLDGDQLTEECARNVQWVFQDGDDMFDRQDILMYS